MSTAARCAAAAIMLAAFALSPWGPARAGDSPDDLYAKGRFKEAEAAYQKLDMDHPADLRYRYNRGCAAFQGGNLDEALAAFTSVARRSADDGMKLRALYNLGNTAYKKGDYGAARDSFARALAVDPGDADARHNLELSLKALKKEQEAKKDQQSREGKDKQGNNQQGKDGQGKDQQGKDGRQSGQDQGRNGQQQDRGRQDQSQQDGNDRKQGGRDEGQQGQSQAGRDRQEGKQDLSGELKGKNMGTGNETNGNPQGMSPAAAMEKKRAEALLDNTKENRARARELKGVQGGIPVGSGKEW